MEISTLLLKKEELPILYDRCFEIPIHPALLDPRLSFDPGIAQHVFPKAAEEWYKDLKKYTKGVKDSGNKKWIQNIFLKEKPNISSKNGHQVLDVVWQDDVSTDSNGFASALSISRNSGGTLYYTGDRASQDFLSFDGNKYMRFPREKIKAFGIEEINHEDLHGVKIKKYSHHNIDNYPGALFLRNWAIEYMNEIFRRYPTFFT